MGAQVLRPALYRLYRYGLIGIMFSSAHVRRVKSMPTIATELPMQEIRRFCERNGVRRLALFGSVLSDEFRDDSDIDMLVEFEPGMTPGLDFFRMEDELAAIVGRKVDLNTKGFLNEAFRGDVLEKAVTVFEKA